MTAAEAEQLIARVLEGELELQRTAHAKQRLIERDLSMLDVHQVLRRHLMEQPPRWSESQRNYVAPLLGLDRAGRRTRVVLALTTEPRCVLVTVMRVRGSGIRAEEQS